MHLAYINYEIAKRNFELNVRLKDQAFEQIVAPPARGHAGPGPVGQRGDPDHQPAELPGQLDRRDARLDQRLASLPDASLIVYRDIGILPYDEWEAFSELFPAQYHGPIIGHAPAGGAGFTPPPEARTATPESR